MQRSSTRALSHWIMLPQTLRVVVRRLFRAWPFSLTAIVTITVCIGVNAALLSFLMTLAVRPQPGLARPSELFQLLGTDARRGWNYPSMRIAGQVERDSLQTATLSSYEPQFVGFTLDTRVTRLVAEAVSRNFFSVTGAAMAKGRALVVSDFDSAATTFPIVISYRLWDQEFGRSEAILGSRVKIEGSSSYQVVGVAAPGFHGPEGLVQADLWIPRTAPLRGSGRGRVIGRRHGASDLRAVGAELATRWARADTSSRRSRQASAAPVFVSRLDSGLHYEQYWAIRVLLGGAFAVTLAVLLLACVNLSGLSLARVMARERELAVSRAIGASRRRLLADVLLEVLVVFAVGGLLGVLLARSVAGLLVGALGTPFPFVLQFEPDALTLVATTTVCLLAAGVAAIIPAARGASMDPASALRADGVASAGSRLVRRTQNGLVVAQIGICVCLLSCAVIVYRSVSSRLNADIGVERPTALVVAPLPQSAAAGDLARRLRDRLADDPDVMAVATAYHGPAEGPLLRITVQSAAASSDSIMVSLNGVSPEFFQTVAPLRRGRNFSAGDDTTSTRVAIIDERMAKRLFGGVDPIGRSVSLSDQPGRAIVIVGIAPPISYDLDRSMPVETAYFPSAQMTPGEGERSLVIRTRGGSGVTARVDSLIREGAPGLFAARSQTVAEMAREQSRRSRAVVTLLSAAAGMTLFLAIIGVYGLIAFSASLRRREIGVRRALGATGPDVLFLFSRQTARLASVGLLLGAALSTALYRVLPKAWAAVGLAPSLATSLGIMALASIAASMLAVARTANVDPNEALRAT